LLVALKLLPFPERRTFWPASALAQEVVQERHSGSRVTAALRH
jgi:hypothetical protein